MNSGYFSNNLVCGVDVEHVFDAELQELDGARHGVGLEHRDDRMSLGELGRDGFAVADDKDVACTVKGLDSPARRTRSGDQIR